MNYSEQFRSELSVCAEMFGKDYVADRLQRLEEIFLICENYWNANLEKFDSREVKYILICEAPPWTDPEKPPTYFYSLENYKTPILTPVYQAFTGTKPDNAMDYKLILEELRTYGFLVFDTIPVSLPYSGYRNSLFDSLVESSVQSYLLHRIADPRINWSKDARIAFQFTVNARSVMKALNYELTIPDQGISIELSEDLIVTDGSGYRPDLDKLKDVFDLG